MDSRDNSVRRHSLSLPVLLLTIVAVPLLAGALYFIHSWRLSSLSHGLLALAAVEEGKENWLKAAEHLDRYLRIQPTDARASARLALDFSKFAAKSGAQQRAIELCYRALSAGETDDSREVRVALASHLLLAGRYLEAEREAQVILNETAEDPTAVRVLALAYFAQWRNGAIDASRLNELHILRHMEAASGLNPKDVVLTQALAALYLEHPKVVHVDWPESNEASRKEKAREAFEVLVNSSPNDALAYLARYDYRTSQQIDGAEEDLKAALRLAPEDPQVLMTAASAALRQAQMAAEAEADKAEQLNRFHAARDLYRVLVRGEVAGGQVDSHVGLGDAHRGAGESDEAIAAWNQGLKAVSQPTAHVVLHSRIADILVETNRHSEAATSLDRIDALLADIDASVSRDARSALMQAQDLRRGSWHLQKSEPLVALPHLQRVVSRQVTDERTATAVAFGWNQLGRAFAMLGEWDESAVAFDQAVLLQPKTMMYRLAAAQAWLQVNRPDLAIDRIEVILSNQPTVEAWFLMARAEFTLQRQMAKSERSWDRFLSALGALKNSPVAQSGIGEAWRIDLLEAQYLSMRSLDGDIDKDQVRNAVLAGFEKYPDKSTYWLQGIPLLEQSSLPMEADKALAEMRNGGHSSLDVTIARARLSSLRKKFAEGMGELESAMPSTRAEDLQRLRQELMQIAVSAGATDKVKDLLQRELSERPHDLNVMRTLTEIDLLRKDMSAVAKREVQLKAMGSVGAFWARYFATLRKLANAKGSHDPVLQEALREQAKLAAIRPQWPQVHVLRGMIEQQLNHLELAAAAYEQAVELGASDVTLYERLIFVLDRLNRSADVEKYLSLYEAQAPLSQRLTEVASSHQLKRDPAQAVLMARQAVDKDPDNVESRLWLARLLMTAGGNEAEKSEAEFHFKQAVEKSPKDLKAWSGLFSYYLRKNDRAAATSTLEDMSDKAQLDSNERSFVVAQGYELLGDWETAISHYREAAKLAPKNAVIQVRLANVLLRKDPSLAKVHLRRAVVLDPSLSQARRMLAVVLASSGVEADMREAETLLSEVKNGAIIATEDQRLRALLLAQQGGADRVDRAVRILEEIIAKGKGVVPGDRVVLSQLYEHQAARIASPNESNARYKQAREQLFALAALSDATPVHLIAMSEFSLRRGDTAEAQRWAAKADGRLTEAKAPDAETTLQLTGLLVRLRDFERADYWVNKLEGKPEYTIRSLALRANLLHVQGKVEELEKLLADEGRRHFAAAKSPEDAMKLARSLGDICSSVQNYVEAERWYRELADRDPDQVAPLILAIAQQKRVDESIQLCLSKNESASSPRFAALAASILAETGAVNGTAERAEPMIQAALSKHSHDATLLNSVAMLRLVQERYEDAIPLFREVIKLNPKNVAAMNNLAMILAEVPTQRAEAIRIVDQAIEAVGQHPGLLDTKGAILVYEGRSTDALPLLEIATQGIDVDPRHRFHLAAAYRDLGQVDRAREQLEQAMNSQLENTILTNTDRRLLTEIRDSLSTAP
jgi:tetratricopeptide (TPR) repeat protein